MDKNRIRMAVPLLLEWYRIYKRDLPWRKTRDPYHIHVSEIMLQQTRVEAVKEYYLRFIERFPTAKALASASEEEVLKAWEGLGYYSRARNLLRAAKLVENGYPQTFEEVRMLPGVGDYTAGAICSIAFSLPCPAVDGNVLRILTRLFADPSDIDNPRTRADFCKLLKGVYPKEASDFCQALMELGALLCIPNGKPLCSSCPWREICLAHLSSREEAFPVRREKKARRIEEYTVLVLKKEGKYALQKRGEQGLLAGMYEFPTFKNVDAACFGSVEKSCKAKHIFTHIEWHMTGYLVDADEFFPQYVWRSKDEIASQYALPSAFRAFTKWLV